MISLDYSIPIIVPYNDCKLIELRSTGDTLLVICSIESRTQVGVEGVFTILLKCVIT